MERWGWLEEEVEEAGEVIGRQVVEGGGGGQGGHWGQMRR